MHVSHIRPEDDAGRLAQADPFIVPEANLASFISFENITSIDEAIQLTIADMPNALKLLENS